MQQVLPWVGWTLSILMVLLIALVAALDFYYHTQTLPSVGERVHTWARNYPIYAGLLVVVLGALLGHFFWS